MLSKGTSCTRSVLVKHVRRFNQNRTEWIEQAVEFAGRTDVTTTNNLHSQLFLELVYTL